MFKYTQSANAVILSAENMSSRMGLSYVGTEHILAGLISTPCNAGNILIRVGVSKYNLFKQVQNVVDHAQVANGYTNGVKTLIEKANLYASELNQGYISTEHILLSLVSEETSLAVQLLKEQGVNIQNIFILLGKELNVRFDYDSTKPNAEKSNERELEYQGGTPSKKEETDISKFGVDLNQKAKDGKIDPVIGRDTEIERITQILSRRTKNNPVIIGEPGVGKSAVIEGLAEKIVSGRIPDVLKDKKIFSLDISGMLAGAKYRGEFEERFKEFITEVQNDGNTIVFIDEIHNIVGAGATGDSSMDAAEILKPLLSRGELQTIGATTLDEYRKYIEKDPALERRFQPVTVDEPSVSDTIKILMGIKDKYEAHHKIKITQEAIEAAAKLSERYITDRFLPDKAIDLIDEASSRARLNFMSHPTEVKNLQEQIAGLEKEKANALENSNLERAASMRDSIVLLSAKMEEIKQEEAQNREGKIISIGEAEVAEVVGMWTKIPVSKITQSEADKILNLESELAKRVVGQKSAVEAVSRAIRRARAGLKDPKRPIGSFIFVGPTGVGKTELTKALSYSVFGSEEAMIRMDMSEFMEKHTISKLIGAPPGYVGHDESGGLTEKIRRNPYSVVLFDEIEKAHPDVFNLMLQILDDGRLTDSKGRVVDFKNTVIIMTSNAGASEIGSFGTLGFASENGEIGKNTQDNMEDRVTDALKQTFRPEFLNRVDEIIVFKHLTKEDTRQIANILIESLSKRVAERNITLLVSDSAKDFLAGKGYDTIYGARPLKRVLQRELEDKLSEEILMGNVKNGDTMRVESNGEKLIFTKYNSDTAGY
ncbi:MAG: ATP-dependent Clp protease ATP-binding subunit [Bacillota bacterium]